MIRELCRVEDSYAELENGGELCRVRELGGELCRSR